MCVLPTIRRSSSKGKQGKTFQFIQIYPDHSRSHFQGIIHGVQALTSNLCHHEGTISPQSCVINMSFRLFRALFRPKSLGAKQMGNPSKTQCPPDLQRLFLCFSRKFRPFGSTVFHVKTITQFSDKPRIGSNVLDVLVHLRFDALLRTGCVFFCCPRETIKW